MTELPHQAYADLIADSLDPGGPSGPYAPDEYLAERYIDGTLVATYYFRRTQPRRVQRDPDLRELDVVLEPVVDAKAWPHGLTLYWTSSEGWQYGPLGAEYEDLADWHEPLPVDRLASPGALRALLPALFAGDTEDLPASTDRWYQPGRSAQLAAQLALAPQDAAYGPEEEAVGMTDADRLRAAVAAVPMAGTVGQLRALLEQLPDEMSLWLDDHHRALPGESDHDALTVHPSLVGVVSEAGTEAARKEHGLMLTQVYVPRVGEEERAAVATRSDLPPDGEHARAAYFLERGELRPGLKDVAQSLMDLTYLVGEVAAGYVETGSDAHQALQVETERITQAAARVSKLADKVKAAQ
ncbi:hypothetical protein [Streptacidiphilus carbonis]|uniref:hypothetical protein n=1 Tax=Streptacidiphilus carbonis TaxID=105422 RepID=UPI0006944207|nr:hypothetical protein [Streptacidiphilus carbonis]